MKSSLPRKFENKIQYCLTMTIGGLKANKSNSNSNNNNIYRAVKSSEAYGRNRSISSKDITHLGHPSWIAHQVKQYITRVTNHMQRTQESVEGHFINTRGEASIPTVAELLILRQYQEFYLHRLPGFPLGRRYTPYLTVVRISGKIQYPTALDSEDLFDQQKPWSSEWVPLKK